MVKREAIRVVVADDHELIRQGIKNLLQSARDIEVIGEVASGDDAIHYCGELQPHVLILDVRMPGPTTLEVVVQIRAICPNTRIVVLSLYDEYDVVESLVKAGISGYLLKDEPAEQLVAVLRGAVKGKKYFSSEIVNHLASMVAEEPSEVVNPTAREREVLTLLVQGQTDTQIAEILGIGTRTLRYHLTNLFHKTGTSTRTALVVHALQKGWVSLDSTS